MKLLVRNSLILLLLGLFIYSCADMRDNINTTAPVLTVHKTGIIDPGSPNFHGNLVKQNGWSFAECIQCHSAQFTGGTTGQSCYQCHTEAAGPQACNTCHGDFSDSTRIAPPRDTNGGTSTSLVSVGAHSNHLYTNVLGRAVSCSNCHVVPKNFSDPGHIGQGLATVVFSGLADTNVASNASFNPGTASCANTYCHGNFEFKKSDAVPTNQFAYIADKIVGNNFTPTWNIVDGSQDSCGTCHGIPPTGHLYAPITACYLCHEGVVDENGKIIDKDKHINGYKSARGSLNKLQEFMARQAAIKTAE
jgi:hypothetical protein